MEGKQKKERKNSKKKERETGTKKITEHRNTASRNSEQEQADVQGWGGGWTGYPLY